MTLSLFAALPLLWHRRFYGTAAFYGITAFMAPPLFAALLLSGTPLFVLPLSRHNSSSERIPVLHSSETYVSII